jgi:uncharacterized protein YfdQ (DUF2303 family)
MNVQDINIAETLARVLPTAKINDTPVDSVKLITLPEGVTEKTVDLEKYLAEPRRKSGIAVFSTIDSFSAYVATHASAGTTAWAKFDPQTFALDFTGVLDEHSKDSPGWRGHRATYRPDMSAEWKTWIGGAYNGKEKKVFSQVDFAEFIEANATDILAGEGLPTDLQMLTMATNFVANEERKLKSTVRLQSGGTRLEYVADVDAGTTEAMEMFAKFQIAIPVFQDGPAYPIVARLKYRQKDGKVAFFYELVRVDRVHRTAAMEQIQVMREALGTTAPLLMGSMS